MLSLCLLCCTLCCTLAVSLLLCPSVRPSVCPSVRRGSGWQGGWVCGQGGTGAPRYRGARERGRRRELFVGLFPHVPPVSTNSHRNKQPARSADRAGRRLAAFCFALLHTAHSTMLCGAYMRDAMATVPLGVDGVEATVMCGPDQSEIGVSSHSPIHHIRLQCTALMHVAAECLSAATCMHVLKRHVPRHHMHARRMHADLPGCHAVCPYSCVPWCGSAGTPSPVR